MPGSHRDVKERPSAPDDRDFAELAAVFADLPNRRQRAFLTGFVAARGIRAAEGLSGVSRWSHYEWMSKDPLYAERFRLAKQMIADDFEDEAHRRAFAGVDTPVVYRGEITASYKRYSDALAIFVLKAMKPEVYNRRRGEPELGVDAPVLGHDQGRGDATGEQSRSPSTGSGRTEKITSNGGA